MKKQDVCVKLTRKNCKKVLEILEMFGEPVFDPDATDWRVGEIWSNDIYAIFDISSEWAGHTQSVKNTGYSNRIIIKPKELKQILARENLKKADKDLLEPKPKSEFGVKEFVVGEWYKSNLGSIICFQSDGKTFGIGYDNVWHDSVWRIDGLETEYRKATEAEVIEALKKECVKRYGEDWDAAKINAHADVGCNSPVNNGSVYLLINTITVWNKNGNLFYRGKWAELLKQPETYTREVWVNHYSDHEFYIHKTRAAADEVSQGPGKITVKATLTYDIPMTKV